MKTRMDVRGGRLRVLGALAACLTTTAGAYAVAPDQSSAQQAASVTMAGAGKETTVRYGARLRLSGRVAPAAGQPVRLEYAPRGDAWRQVATATTGAEGSYRFAIRARRSGTYRAVTDGGVSAPRDVVVAARLSGRATRHVRAGERVRVRGVVTPAAPGRRVTLKIRVGGRWKAVDRTRTAADGGFAAAWRPRAAGAYRVKVAFGGDSANAASSRALARVYAYRASFASWYGPGFYGNRTACGSTLGYGTLGVAHRTLPCGTRLRVRHRGRSVAVRVIDRGPFHYGREFDLTGATKRAIGFGSTGRIWVTR